MCICVCVLDNDENVFHVDKNDVYLTTMRMFSMCIVCVLDNDENVFHVYLCVFRQR